MARNIEIKRIDSQRVIGIYTVKGTSWYITRNKQVDDIEFTVADVRYAWREHRDSFRPYINGQEI